MAARHGQLPLKQLPSRRGEQPCTKVERGGANPAGSVGSVYGVSWNENGVDSGEASGGDADGADGGAAPHAADSGEAGERGEIGVRGEPTEDCDRPASEGVNSGVNGSCSSLTLRSGPAAPAPAVATGSAIALKNASTDAERAYLGAAAVRRRVPRRRATSSGSWVTPSGASQRGWGLLFSERMTDSSSAMRLFRRVVSSPCVSSLQHPVSGVPNTLAAAPAYLAAGSSSSYTHRPV